MPRVCFNSSIKEVRSKARHLFVDLYGLYGPQSGNPTAGNNIDANGCHRNASTETEKRKEDQEQEKDILKRERHVEKEQRK